MEIATGRDALDSGIDGALHECLDQVHFLGINVLQIRDSISEEAVANFGIGSNEVDDLLILLGLQTEGTQGGVVHPRGHALADFVEMLDGRGRRQLLGETGNRGQQRDVRHQVCRAVQPTLQNPGGRIGLPGFHECSTHTVGRGGKPSVDEGCEVLGILVHVLPVADHLRKDGHLAHHLGKAQGSDDTGHFAHSGETKLPTRGEVAVRNGNAEDAIQHPGGAVVQRFISQGSNDLSETLLMSLVDLSSDLSSKINHLIDGGDLNRVLEDRSIGGGVLRTIDTTDPEFLVEGIDQSLLVDGPHHGGHILLEDERKVIVGQISDGQNVLSVTEVISTVGSLDGGLFVQQDSGATEGSLAWSRGLDRTKQITEGLDQFLILLRHRGILGVLGNGD